MAIKSTLVTPPNKAKEIDWSKRSVLIADYDEYTTIVISTGEHELATFSAVLLHSTFHKHNVGLVGWDKEKFRPITTPITITFENE
jgi:uncharacterized protein YvpB